MTNQTQPPRTAAIPLGLNHVVLNVRDIEESHRFWTEIVGLRHVGTGRTRTESTTRPPMRFYSGVRDGELTHHDLALMQTSPWPETAVRDHSGLNHVAIALPDRDAFLAQLAFLRSRGIDFKARIERGVTHSVHIADPNGHDVELLYELPRTVWAGDIDGALNYARRVPTEGDAALADRQDTPSFHAEPAADIAAEIR